MYIEKKNIGVVFRAMACCSCLKIVSVENVQKKIKKKIKVTITTPKQFKTSNISLIELEYINRRNNDARSRNSDTNINGQPQHQSLGNAEEGCVLTVKTILK